MTALTEALAELATLTVEPNAIEPNASEPRTVDPEVVQPDASESGSAGPDTDGIHSSTGPGNQEGSCQPSGREVDPWAAVDVLELARENRLERLGCIRRLEAHLAAIKTLTLAECISIDDALTPPNTTPTHEKARAMSLVAEVSGVLTLGAGASNTLLNTAHQLVTTQPLTLAALANGDISYQHARALCDETTDLAPTHAAALEEHLFNPASTPAGDLIPGRLKAKARTWRERHHPDSIQERHTRSATNRRVEHTPDHDGMAWINAYLPAHTAEAIYNRVTAISRALQHPSETRTLTQLRADVLATAALTAGLSTHLSPHATTSPDDCVAEDWATAPDEGNSTSVTTDTAMVGAVNQIGSTAGGTGSGLAGSGLAGSGLVDDPGYGVPGDAFREALGLGKVPTPAAQVLITVPILALLGITEEPAVLDGHGPIPPSLARELFAHGAGSFYRVLVDPRNGAPLDIGRTRYRLTTAMRRWLTLRDAHCTFPGCSNHSADNDIDHLTAWHENGTTSITNTAQLCPKHHRLKHNSTWTPTPATTATPPGWTSPSGRYYPAEQSLNEPTHLPPHWTQQKQADSAMLPDQHDSPSQPSQPILAAPFRQNTHEDGRELSGRPGSSEQLARENWTEPGLVYAMLGTPAIHHPGMLATPEPDDFWQQDGLNQNPAGHPYPEDPTPYGHPPQPTATPPRFLVPQPA
ncbi:HNH endonuclease signature motif containing protein [Arthrobacter ulcerisalmonis]|uniref:HNH endonuclease signature motif containing protein n=1 Tax=Arthrobacter ulcerisalmonis TaxID=2483813 RepID=UPI0013571AED|nr:HNH endonuclease signature motif containing protein [Arthrobacter ulcerisalmonis]